MNLEYRQCLIVKHFQSSYWLMARTLLCHEIHETCNSVTFYFLSELFSDTSRKFILPNMFVTVPALFIFGKMHFLLISENEFIHEIKRDGMTSFAAFMMIIVRGEQPGDI